MSLNTVQLWEDAYKFNEHEVAFLADWQISLMDPLNDMKNNIDETYEHDVSGQHFTSTIPKVGSDIDSAVERLYDLAENLQMTAERIISMHEEVKVKALVLQSLWNGMVSEAVGIYGVFLMNVGLEGQIGRGVEGITEAICPICSTRPVCICRKKSLRHLYIRLSKVPNCHHC